jgi:hypothetical protein
LTFQTPPQQCFQLLKRAVKPSIRSPYELDYDHLGHGRFRVSHDGGDNLVGLEQETHGLGESAFSPDSGGGDRP